jgi:perosamine synthetase
MIIKKLLLKNRMIPVSSPVITKEDINYVQKALKEGWVSSAGPYIGKFEKIFSQYIEKKHCIALSSGTAALEVALKALGIKKGDEVIIPNFTIISNALAVVKLNAKFIPIECDLDTWNMNIKEIEKKITKKTKAIIATHIYNFPLQIDLIKKICVKNKIFLIEDAAEVLGLQYKNKKCGYYGDISIFSFYSNKQITTGEGGMICTNNLLLAKKCRSLINLCFGNKDRFLHNDIGWNYRMTNIQAALGISQLKRINQIVKKKMSIGMQYYQKLKNNKNIYFPAPKNKFSKNIYWVIAIVIKNTELNINAKKLSQILSKLHIMTRPFFWPMSEQIILKKFNSRVRDKFPNSKYICQYGLYLPSGLNLKSSEIDYICKKINDILA